MELYLSSPHIPSWCAHGHYLLLWLSATFDKGCQLLCLLYYKSGPKHAHNKELSTLLYAGTVWVIYAHPASNNYCHETFMYKTCGKVNTQWSYSCPCAHHKGVWKNGRTAPLTSELNRVEQSASRPNRFTTGERTPVFTVKDAGWAQQSVCTLWKREKSLAPIRNRTFLW
jgi:hypothetical protein